MLAENRKKVMELLVELTPLVIGKRSPERSCGCGCISHGPAMALSIEPGGRDRSGGEALWHFWSVRMHCQETGKSLYGTGLDEFIPVETVRTIFAKYFPDNFDGKSPYDLLSSGYKRIEAGLAAAVRISDNNFQTRVSFDWGTDQIIASEIHQLYQEHGRIAKGTKAFERLSSLLYAIKPTVYAGGPDPVLLFENAWLMDYKLALVTCQVGERYRYVFFQNLGKGFERDSAHYSHCDVVFSKLGLTD